MAVVTLSIPSSSTVVNGGGYRMYQRWVAAIVRDLTNDHWYITRASYVPVITIRMLVYIKKQIEWAGVSEQFVDPKGTNRFFFFFLPRSE